MLPLWREHNYQGSGPPKINPKTDSERQRHKKTQKIASTPSPDALFQPRARFWLILGSRPGLRIAPRPTSKSTFQVRVCTPKIDFLRCLRSDTFWKSPEPHPKASGTRSERISGMFFTLWEQFSELTRYWAARSLSRANSLINLPNNNDNWARWPPAPPHSQFS